MLDFANSAAANIQLDVALTDARNPGFAYTAASLPWSTLPVPGDRRTFSAVPGWERDACAPRGLAREIASGLTADARLDLNGLCRLSGRSFRETLPAVRDLVARGVLRDTEGTHESSDDWRDFCLSVLAVVPFAKAPKATYVKPLLSNPKLAEVVSALETLDARGLLADPANVSVAFSPRGASEAPVAAPQPAAAPAEVPAAPEASAPSDAPRTRRARGTAPVKFWTKSRHRVLSEALGERAGEFPLPALEVEAKRLVKRMEEAVNEIDPGILTRATSRQRELVSAILEELVGNPEVASPFEGSELSKADAQEFIARWMPLRPASERQVMAAQEIAASLGVEVPTTDGRHLHVQVGKFIGEHRNAQREARRAVPAASALAA